MSATIRTPIIDKNGKATHVHKSVTGPVKPSASRAAAAPTPPRASSDKHDIDDDRSRLVALSTVKERDGWTDAAVKRFLGEPDEWRANPRYRSAAPMKLFRVGRIEDVEDTDEWVAWRDLSLRRSEASSKLIEERQKAANEVLDAELRAFLETMAVQFKRQGFYSQADATRDAIGSYNEYQREVAFDRGSYWTPASESSDPAFLARIRDNFVRHELTNYDRLTARGWGEAAEVIEKHRAAFVGLSGWHERAYSQVADRVTEAIKERFPWYGSGYETINRFTDPGLADLWRGR